jgi:Domain of unknown function (DUF3291)
VDWHLAQINIGRLRAPIDDPLIAEFRDALAEINAVAERSPGFVWRLQTAEGDATALHPTGEELVIPNMSLWESAEALADFVLRSDHTPFLRRRREWFERYESAYVALWWVPAGHIPTLGEGMERLAILDRDGPTEQAFTFARRFPAPRVEAA